MSLKVASGYASTPVGDLFRPGGPFAVAGLVIAVVVDALKLQAGRRRPHVGIERNKTVTPMLAHGDPACAVVAKRRVVRIQAPRLGLCPCVVLFTARPTPGVAVLLRSLSRLLVGATATLGASVLERHGKNRSLRSTVAATHPARVRPAAGALANNCPPPVAPSGSVDKCRHRPNITHVTAGVYD